MLNMIWEFKIKSTAEQAAEIERTLLVCRKVWNFALRERKDWVASQKSPINTCSLQQECILPLEAPFPNYVKHAKRLTQAKKDSQDLMSINAQMLQQVLRKLEVAWKAWLKERSGLTRFKTQGQMRCFVVPQMLKNCISTEGIKLPQLGFVKVRWSQDIPALFSMKQAGVVCKASDYFVLLTLETDVGIPVLPFHGHSIGIDVGFEHFLSTSERPLYFESLYRKLKLLQRRLKTKKIGSHNGLRLQRKISRVHQRIAETRKDWLFKPARKLCDQAGSVFVEDLNFRIMTKGFLSIHTLDTGLGQFTKQILPWVCWKRDVYYGKVEPLRTSQECPDCGAKVKKGLNVRVHQYSEYVSTKPRDIVADQVICALEQRATENVCGEGLLGISATVSIQGALKQEIFWSTQIISLHSA